APVGAQLNGFFDSLALGANAVARLKIEGQAAPLSGLPGRADLAVTAASVTAGTTALGALALSFKLRDQDVAAAFSMASPARLDVKAAGRIDDDRHGVALDALTIAFPGDRWTSQGTALLRFENAALSLANFRLVSGQQILAIDGAKHAEDIAGHLALTGLRLDRLPAALIDPALHLDGQLDADIKASGRTDAPRVAAKVALKQVRYQGFSKIDATLVAALHDQQVDGTATVEAPFLRAHAAVNVSTEAPAPGAPIDLRLDVRQLDVSQVLRAAQKDPLGDGRINLKLHLKGSADQPDVDLLVDGLDLAVSRPAKAAQEPVQEPGKAAKPIDIGQARVHLTYAQRAARLNLDFRSSHGGTLLVDAAAHVDLGYPRLTQERLAVAKIPIRGKVVARNLNVAWIARFNPRVESLGGQVTADVRLAGTVGDPQFIGDVRWKNGQVVTTGPAPAAATTAPAPTGRRQAAGRPSSSAR
ncbi:MAG: translocation and assembly module TamB, partial [Myxococcales bacterium]|nr:translocation and assembly module TamB [Myxococcales bacterium]